MSHSFYKIWLHIVFGTKNRLPLISSSIEDSLYKYLGKQLKELECEVVAVNGMPDHIHILISMNPKKSIADIIKQLKGSSSHWINQQDLITQKFSWQTGYGVFSVSESQINKVKAYIENQKEHHHKTSFKEEYQQFLKIHNINTNG
jgi:REP-associated tyrosine transposase